MNRSSFPSYWLKIILALVVSSTGYVSLAADVNSKQARPTPEQAAWHGQSLAETSGDGNVVELQLPKSVPVDHVITMEQIADGERVREYVLEGWTGDKWQTLCQATTIGHKKIDRFMPTEVSKIRFRCLKSAAPPRIRKLAAYAVGG